MTERKQVEEWMEKALETMEYAKQVHEDSMRVEQGDPDDYIDAQQQLEQVNGHLDALLRVATPEQREQLTRTQQQLRQIQNQLIVRLR